MALSQGAALASRPWSSARIGPRVPPPTAGWEGAEAACDQWECGNPLCGQWNYADRRMCRTCRLPGPPAPWGPVARFWTQRVHVRWQWCCDQRRGLKSASVRELVI